MRYPDRRHRRADRDLTQYLAAARAEFDAARARPRAADGMPETTARLRGAALVPLSRRVRALTRC